MTIVNPFQTATYDLNAADNPVIFGAETQIAAASGPGVRGDLGTTWTVVNEGSISASGGSGVSLDGSGTVTNRLGGTIAGAGAGVTVAGAAGTVAGGAGGVSVRFAGLEADRAHIDSVTAKNGVITATVAELAVDQPILDKVVGGFAVADTAANIAGGLAALDADASHIASITASDGNPVTVGNGLFSVDQAALDRIAGGFWISGQANVLSGNLAGLEADRAHINSVTAKNGAITASVAELAVDQPILDKVVGGFAVSDTAANIAGGLATLDADASHIASITASDGNPVTVGNGLFSVDQAALDRIAGGFWISGQANVLSGNLDGLQNDVGHINAITGKNGVITGAMASFDRDETALNKVVGGFDLRDSAANIVAGLDLLQKDVGNIHAITLSDASTPTIALTAAQAAADHGVLSRISSPFTLVTT